MVTLVSTVAFKTLPTADWCEEFKSREITHIELNLTPFIIGKESIELAKARFRSNEISIEIGDGGWCDFTVADHEYISVCRRIEEQVRVLNNLDCTRLRLFLGNRNSIISPRIIQLISSRLNALGRTFPKMEFMIETHDNRSCNPTVWEMIFENLTVTNISIVVDFVNIMTKSTFDWKEYVKLKDYVSHLHFKGLSTIGELCFPHQSESLTRQFVEFAALHFKSATHAVESEGLFSDDIDQLLKSKELIETLFLEQS